MIDALASITGFERYIFRKTVVENSSIVDGVETSAKVVCTSGFSSWIHMVMARQYVIAGAALLMTDTAFGLVFNDSQIHHWHLAALQIIAPVAAVFLFIAGFYRLYTAQAVKRKFIGAGREQASLGVQKADPKPVVTVGVIVSFVVLGLDVLTTGLVFVSSPFAVTRSTGVFFVLMSLFWIGAALKMTGVRRRGH